MKKILIAATAVGAAVAGLILYNQRKNSRAARVEKAAKDAYNAMNDGLGKVERNTMHSMG